MRNLLIIKVSQNPYEVLDMSEENIALLKEQSEKVRVEEIMRFIRILQEAEEQSKWVKQSRVYLELAIIKMCKIEYDTSKEIILSRLNMLEEVMKSGEIKVSCENITSSKSQYKNEIEKDNIMKSDQAKSSKNQDMVRPIEQFNPDSKVNIDMVRKYWKDILETFKGKRLMVIYASLMTAVPLKCINGEITLMYGKEYAFNKQRLEKENNSEMVENIFSQVLKDKVRIKYIIEDEKDEVIEKDPEQVLKNTFGENIVEIIEE
ncbi:hypothetical protein N071400001_00230 [Clostridium tetani]|nr:hypothetical protein N071400001_00230 [Clostridium tetani]